MADRITMHFPADTGYTAAIRLAVSAIAAKLGCRVDEIEDIKSCVSEACILLMNGQRCEALVFTIDAGADLRIRVTADGIEADNDRVFEDFSEEVSKLMIEALSDGCSFTEENGLLSQVCFNKTVVQPRRES